MYIGIGADSDPNTYSYDMVFKNNTKELVLDSQRLPVLAGLAEKKGFAVSIYVHGIENKTNTLLDYMVTVSFTTKKKTEVKQKAISFTQ